MGAKAVELLCKGRKQPYRSLCKHGEYVDFDIQEALNMHKDIPEDQYQISRMLVR